MTCAIIARCDNGGLAALTREVYRHMHPVRTLLVDMKNQRRGECDPTEYEADYRDGRLFRTEYDGALPRNAIEWLCAEGVDTLWSAETFYSKDDELLRAAHASGIRTVVLAMPELAPWGHDLRSSAVHPRVITTPTPWRMETLPPNAQLLSFPVARDRLIPTRRKELFHLYHVTGVAMRDRNGTQLLLNALPFVQSEILVTIRSERYLEVPPCKPAVTVLMDSEVDYWRSYPHDIDLLVLPRRYGGLSLPIQECASLGVPSLTLQTDPYAQLPFVMSIPATGAVNVPMKGAPRDGVPVYDGDPQALAHVIDWLVEHPQEIEFASIEADSWAERASWHGVLGAQWCRTLTCSET